MSKWEMVRLGDVFELQMGKTPSRNNNEYWNDGSNKWVSISDLSGSSKYIEKTKETITNLAVKESGIKIVPKNSVIMSFKLSLGKTSITSEDMYTNEAIMAFLKKKTNTICNDFIYYVFRNKNWAEYTNKAVMGVTLNKAILINIKIPMPPIEIQKHIAQTLDKVTEIITLHKKRLEELDNLIKAIFYEMFGDSVLNDKGWEVKKMIEITSKIGSGATPRGGQESYKESGISLVRSLNVHNGFFKYEQLAFIDDIQAKQLENATLKENDVLINITGASVGRSCVIPKDVLPARVNQHVSILRTIDDCINCNYLNNLLIGDSYQKKLIAVGRAGGATREAITKQQLQELIVPVPPIQLQNKFAQIVTKIEEQKILEKQAISESENLFNSLMSKYFD